MELNTHLGRLRVMALSEGLTCILLYLIAMPLKYILGIESAVKIPGMIHGVFFVLYLLALLPVYFEQKWNFGKLFVCGVASIVPFMTFWADKKYFQNTPTENKNSEVLDD